jgi:hypothetical protein
VDYPFENMDEAADWIENATSAKTIGPRSLTATPRGC